MPPGLAPPPGLSALVGDEAAATPCHVPEPPPPPPTTVPPPPPSPPKRKRTVSSDLSELPPSQRLNEKKNKTSTNMNTKKTNHTHTQTKTRQAGGSDSSSHDRGSVSGRGDADYGRGSADEPMHKSVINKFTKFVSSIAMYTSNSPQAGALHTDAIRYTLGIL